jgi:hypothetical protein
MTPIKIFKKSGFITPKKRYKEWHHDIKKDMKKSGIMTPKKIRKRVAS